jgi:hypothetical protein
MTIIIIIKNIIDIIIANAAFPAVIPCNWLFIVSYFPHCPCLCLT